MTILTIGSRRREGVFSIDVEFGDENSSCALLILWQ